MTILSKAAMTTINAPHERELSRLHQHHRRESLRREKWAEEAHACGQTLRYRKLLMQARQHRRWAQLLSGLAQQAHARELAEAAEDAVRLADEDHLAGLREAGFSEDRIAWLQESAMDHYLSQSHDHAFSGT